MEVKLLAASILSPEFPAVPGLTSFDSLIAYAIADCYQTEPNDKAIIRCLSSGHTSVIEHLSFTFSVRGISRACLAQLTRHRIASYTVESQRYTDYSKENKDLSFVEPHLPDAIPDKNKEIVLEHIRDSYNNSFRTYKYLRRLGVPAGEARFVLPNAATTNLTLTMNARSLLNAFSLRLDKRAQWEIRELFTKIYHIVSELAPVTFGQILLD